MRRSRPEKGSLLLMPAMKLHATGWLTRQCSGARQIT
ncbi:integrin-linked kinase-associated serine/threonine phosphatase 2C, isoform CRA_j [Rattus norvegicus]|uniref:Integrin-linked kinase-associated serine/threonine phosphatase 2C, isoform CRA_j n=1 Tax=Rattus norvegicus TaxID=10116 RepID=A6JQR5_RAT|nr:integrin-linked kinase-associated serine/threonine phosphatase 2C, isoform CRA_j [Rattus norvegicus]EDL92027.1 integrin-linked kinase-associated serine/threonine phosphatase 2C, isoform CRA_j [Rattus norvegicus]